MAVVLPVLRWLGYAGRAAVACAGGTGQSLEGEAVHLPECRGWRGVGAEGRD